MENTDQRGAGIENGSEWSNGTVHFDRTGPTEKSGPPRKVDRFLSKLFQLGRTDPFSFRPKFPEILVEWIAPCGSRTMREKSALHTSSQSWPRGE